MSLENVPNFLLNFSLCNMKGEEKHLYRFKSFRLNVEERQLLHHDTTVPLTPKAFDVLAVLVERSGHLVEKDELLKLVWADSFVEEANIARIIHTLRKTLGEDESNNKFIETVAKSGYRFVANVSEIHEPKPLIAQKDNQSFSSSTAKLPETTFLPQNKTAVQPEAPEKNAASGKPARRLILIAIILSAIGLVLGTRLSVIDFFKSASHDFRSIEMFRLTENSGISGGDISADGRFVAFVEQKEGKQTLFVKQVSTGATIIIVPPTPMYLTPTFTPDSEFIYYVGVSDGIGALYKVSVLGGESKKLVLDVDSAVTFSPDGKRLAFIRHNPNEGGDTVFTSNSDGTNLEALLESKEAGFSQLVGVDWSPDGERLAFGVVKIVPEPNQRLKLFTITVKDKKLSELACEKSWLGFRNINWLKNGTGIMMIAKASNSEQYQIWYLDYPGGTPRQITSDTNNYTTVSTSSDNSSIVATRAEAISSMWSFNPRSNELKQLLSESNYLIFDNQMSQLPDGRILFVKGSGKETNIFSMSESGADEKQLTSKSGGNYYPVASPDGKYIVFCSNRNDFQEIWRMNPDGSGAMRLTAAENSTDLQPEITPNGKTVIFTRSTISGGNTKLMKVSIEGGEASVLLPENKNSEILPRISPNGKRLVYHDYHYEEQTATNKSSLKVIGLEGEKDDRLILEPMSSFPYNFRWSPDGKSLTYIKRSGVDNIWSMSLNDQRETPLTNFTSGNITDFIWSNDGSKLFLIKTVFNNHLVLIKDKDKKD